MGLGDLAREHEADAAAARLGREERHEEIVGVRDAGAAVLHLEDDGVLAAQGAELDGGRALGRRLDRVPDEIDERLLDLVRVAAEREPLCRRELYPPRALDGDMAMGSRAILVVSGAVALLFIFAASPVITAAGPGRGWVLLTRRFGRGDAPGFEDDRSARDLPAARRCPGVHHMWCRRRH